MYSLFTETNMRSSNTTQAFSVLTEANALNFYNSFYFCCLHPVAWAYKRYIILTIYATILLRRKVIKIVNT
jgi:hypothetical protein